MLETKILPSPMRPVWAARLIASIAFSTGPSEITISIFTLGRKSTIILRPGTAGVALLPAETLGFGDGNTLQSHLLERFLYLVELEWLDDGLYFFH